MAYGGTNVNPMAATGGSTTVRQVKLDKESELRVEVSPDSPLRLRLLTGTAEIFGTEIPPGIWLSFTPRLKFAVCFRLVELVMGLALNQFWVGLPSSLPAVKLDAPTANCASMSLFCHHCH